jgi:hypothetical protein
MASQTAMDNMNACNNSWPTDHTLFEAAKLKAPEQAKKLDDLLEMTEQVMREKDILDHRVGQILGLEVMVAYDWPTDRALFIRAIVKANSLENYALSSELQERWILVKKDMKCKTQLDELIVQILESQTLSETVQNVLKQSGAFEHDYEKHGFFTESDVEEMRKEREGFETKAQWTQEDYHAHCLPKDAGPYDHLTEDDWDEYERQVEAEKRGVWCTTAGHSHSDCDGNHGDEMRDGFILHKGPVISPLTVPQPQAQAQEQIQDYIEEVDQWTKDMVRIIAESKAIREAPLSAFADLAGHDDDDTIPEVDIEAA